MLPSLTTLFLFGLSLSAHVLAQYCFTLSVVSGTNNPYGGQYLQINGSSGTTNYTTTVTTGHGTIFSTPESYTSTMQPFTAPGAPGSPPKSLPLYPNKTTPEPIRWFSSFADGDVDSVQVYCRQYQAPRTLYWPVVFWWLRCSVGPNAISLNICNGTLYGAPFNTELPGCKIVSFYVNTAACPSTTTTSSKTPKPTKSYRLA